MSAYRVISSLISRDKLLLGTSGTLRGSAPRGTFYFSSAEPHKILKHFTVTKSPLRPSQFSLCMCFHDINLYWKNNGRENYQCRTRLLRKRIDRKWKTWDTKRHKFGLYIVVHYALCPVVVRQPVQECVISTFQSVYTRRGSRPWRKVLQLFKYQGHKLCCDCFWNGTHILDRG